MSEYRFQWQDPFTPARFEDAQRTKQQYLSTCKQQKTSSLSSNSFLNHPLIISGVPCKDAIVLSDSESEIEAVAVESREGSNFNDQDSHMLQYNEISPSVNATAAFTAPAQADNINKTAKHGAASNSADEASCLRQLDLSIIGQPSEESTIDTIVSIPRLDRFTKPTYSLPQADEADKADEAEDEDEELQNLENIKDCISYVPLDSTSTPLDSISSKPEAYSFLHLSPDIVNGVDAEASDNGTSPVEPKLPTIEVTQRVDVLHVASTQDRNDYNRLDHNNNSASNKASGYNDYGNNSDDGDDEDDENDGAISEYCPSVTTTGEQEKHHLDDNTDDENKQSPRKRRKHEQSLDKSGLSDCGRGSHSPASTRPSTPIAENTPTKNLPSPTVSNSAAAIFEECNFSDGTIVKRTIIDGTEILQIKWPGAEGEWRHERPYTNQSHVNVNASNKQGKSATELADGRAKRAPYTRVTFTPEEDKLLKELRMEKRLSWDAVYKQFNEVFPEQRSRASLQVRFSTRLKGKRRGVKRYPTFYKPTEPLGS
ncbi:hypothetical protein M441DRAFT_52577 [Trichoderma asperellum CBS 433.97]|uniref:Myb-like domain-containing protein n=1 Tax=Trichoderma asperellum (strain ATCC 204424 / CBS 433.97 / NBRC 101777) TaxID=1042311 RepID=A0A2T3YR01_TRIA4|nr:hypothetical protein M441DRAFT_52577 [Trichoderma asperellum CBS 433.97]PTB34947.1 hypothetical protein M441DRAFT_52577 [Trichoderma asperellum CBS 433.97]